MGFAVDRLGAPELSGVAFYLVAPLMAAVLLSFGAAALTGLAAVVLDLVSLSRHGESVVSEPPSVAAVAVLAVLINRFLKGRIARRASIRGGLGSAALTGPFEGSGPFDSPADRGVLERGADARGRFRLVRTTPYGLRCIVGEVRCEQVRPGGDAAALLAEFRAAADEEPTLAEVVGRMDQALRQQASRCSVTALLFEVPVTIRGRMDR
ncbi:hypothetical protein ACFW3D_29900 [Streptomyces sp. NPDC058864]